MRPLPPVPSASGSPEAVGAPFQGDGAFSTPDSSISYDEVGYADIYGQGTDGNVTASGEPFVSSGVSAAHKTLPLPSYVEVTALGTGKTILVEVNDRAPFSNDRIIALSPGAADQLGLTGDGRAAVRVRLVNPPEQEKAVLRAHGRAAERLDTPPALLTALRARLGKQPVASVAATPSPQPGKKAKAGTSYVAPSVAAAPPKAAASTGQKRGFIVEEENGRAAPASASSPTRPSDPRPAPRSPGGGYIVQVAAFSSQSRADALARRIGATAVGTGGVWRVRYGPYPTQDAAQAGVRQAATKGFENARIMANDAP